MVSLAVHDLRTPLATIVGFARTLQRTELGQPQDRYVEMIVAASEQLAALLDDVGLVTRIENDRWEPNVQEHDSLELARAAADELDGANVTGAGATVRVDADAAQRAVYNVARCALRHGGLEAVQIDVDGPSLTISPITPEAVPVLTRETMRDLGAVTGARVVDALGGALEVSGDRLTIRLPT